MAWKTFTFYEPGLPNGPTRPVEDVFNQIEAEGYEIRFVFKESARYIVLAKRMSIRRS